MNESIGTRSGTALSTQRLTKKYGARTVVDSVDLNVPRGTIYGLVGRNGAGKTTILRMIAGLAAPTDGEISLFGGEKLSSARKKLGTVIETPAVYPQLSGFENLEIMRRTLGLDGAEVSREALELVGLDPNDNKKAKNYSLGMRQRLVIGMALMGEPELLLLDEPMNGLDPLGIASLRETIERINRERSLTVIISSHIISELERIATRYGIIESGRLLREFRADELSSGVTYVTLRTANSLKAGELLRGSDEAPFGSDDAPELEYLPDNTLRIRVPDGVHRDFIAAKAIRALAAGGVDVYEASSGSAGENLEDYILSQIGGGHNA